MKNYLKLLTAIFLSCFYFSAIAQDHKIYPSDWVRFLSDAELIQLSKEEFEKKVNKSNNGDRRATKAKDVLDALRKNNDSEVTQFHIVQTTESSDDSLFSTTTSSSTTSPWVGTIDCYDHSAALSNQNPHATYFDGVRVVKAKSAGQCVYTHIQGQAPSYINYTYVQLLYDFSSSSPFGGSLVATEVHPRPVNTPTASNAVWSASSTFVKSNYCTNGVWVIAGNMFISLPPGYSWAGPVPWGAPANWQSVTNC